MDYQEKLYQKDDKNVLYNGSYIKNKRKTFDRNKLLYSSLFDYSRTDIFILFDYDNITDSEAAEDV